MKKKFFTLMEILIAIIIIALMAVIGLVAYDEAVEKAKARACELNTATIAGALETYILENNQVPGSISKIPDSYIQRSYAKVMNTKDAWGNKLAYWLVDLDARGMAYALTPGNPALSQGAHLDARIFHCPADHSGNASSYGLNNVFSNAVDQASYDALVDKYGPYVPVVGDSTAATFASLEARHKKGIVSPVYFGIGATAHCIIRSDGTIKCKGGGENPPAAQAPGPTTTPPGPTTTPPGPTTTPPGPTTTPNNPPSNPNDPYHHSPNCGGF